MINTFCTCQTFMEDNLGKPTLISHFYNEEFLLQFWIKHHKPLFGHAIMIDYGSTDRSVEIIKKLAPEWEIVPTVNEFFDGGAIDREVMAIEMQFDGWKMCLNTTEFMLHPDLASYIAKFEQEHPKLNIARTTGVYMIDAPQQINDDVDTTKHLVFQKHHGYFEDEQHSPMRWSPDNSFAVRLPRKSRLLHKHTHGAYTSGRHGTKHGDFFKDPNLLLCWFQSSPYQHCIQRRKDIVDKTSPGELAKGKDRWLFDTPEKFHRIWQHHVKWAVNLMEKPTYKKAYDAFFAVRGNESL